MTEIEPLDRRPVPRAEEAASELARRTGALTHDVAVVLGSGWGPAADAFGPPVAEVPFSELPGFTPPGAPDHAGVARSVELGGRRVLVLLGRTHLYEGHGPAQVVHAVRTACAAGATTVILTNAAGGIDPSYAVGQPVLIADHLNLTGRSPLVGPEFVDLTDAYDPGLRALARGIDPEPRRGRVRRAARPALRDARPRSACWRPWAPTSSGCRRCSRRSPCVPPGRGSRGSRW